jgi:hypothetical protein
MSSKILIFQHIKNIDSCEVKKWTSSLLQYEREHLNVYTCVYYVALGHTIWKFGIFIVWKWNYIEQGGQCTCNVEACSHNHCCVGKAISITYCECVSVALVIWHAKHMHHIILSPVACPTLPCFLTLSHKWHDFQEKVIEYKMYTLIFSTFLILPRIQWNIVINVHWPPCKEPCFLVWL